MSIMILFAILIATKPLARVSHPDHTHTLAVSFSVPSFPLISHLSSFFPSASASPRDNNRSLPSPTTYPTSPTLGKGPRPLPRLPGASPTSPSTYPTHMPEPRSFFQDSPKPGAEQCVAHPHSSSSFSPCPLYRSRRQYATDPFGNGSAASPAERTQPSRGLPSDPRPSHKVPVGLRPGSSSGADARSPSPAAGHTRGANSVQYSMPVPDTSPSPPQYGQPWNPSSVGKDYSSNGVQSPGSALQKKPSYRPPGASAPRIPGHSSALASPSPDDSPAASSETYSPMSNASSSYFTLDSNYTSNFSKIPPPPPLNPPAHHQTPVRPKNILERDSSEDILAPGTQALARPLSDGEFSHPFSRYLPDRPDRRSPLAVSSGERPLRSSSTVSTSSSTQVSGLERHLTASTVATMSTLPTSYSGSSGGDMDTIAERTPIDRGDPYLYSSKQREKTPFPTGRAPVLGTCSIRGDCAFASGL
jgi:hypothetical protein